MSTRNKLRNLSIGGIAFSALLVCFLVLGAPSPNSYAEPAPLTQTVAVNSGLPIRLIIPKIMVNAAVEHVGLTNEKAMDAPKGPSTVGWFNLGPRPGETGSAVMDGHFGWKNNTPAVFDDLHLLRKGDTLSVEDENGVATDFVVREIRTYREGESAPDVFSSNDGKAHLNLITCKGVWDTSLKRYPDRLVVFTDKI